MKPNHHKIKMILIGFLFTKIIGACLIILYPTFLQISLFEHSSAIAQEQKPPAPEKKEADPKADKPAAKDQTGADTKGAKKDEKPAAQDLQIELKGLEEKRIAIQKEEEQIKKQREELESLKMEIEEKIDQLAKIRQQIEDSLKKKEQIETEAERKKKAAQEAKLKQLVKVYSSMKPKSAAEIIDRIDLQVAYELFSRMKGEQAGKILSFVNRDRAAVISKLLADKKKVAPK